MLDDRDLGILARLQRDARTSNAQIARELGIAPSAVLERIRKLERRGVLRGYTARVDPASVGLGFVAFVFVQGDEPPGRCDLGETLARFPEVLEVHDVAGEDCYLAKVRCASPEALGRFLRERLGVLPEVRRTRTTVVLETLKESQELALANAPSEEGGE